MPKSCETAESEGLEFHDSVVDAIELVASGAAVVRFESVYIHRSHGVPGVDSGTVWTQRAVARLSSGAIDGAFSEYPSLVADGDLETEAQRYSNIVPLPAAEAGPAKLILTNTLAELVVVSGSGFSIELVGEPEYVETFL